jgi:hypothetical protein
VVVVMDCLQIEVGHDVSRHRCPDNKVPVATAALLSGCL